MIFQKNLVINLIWQHLLNCVRCCQNYYLKNKITELPYVARTTSLNMHTFLFFVLKEHRLIEPWRLKGTFRDQLLLRVRPVTASWLWLGPVQLCAFGRIETIQTLRSACSQSFTTLLLFFFLYQVRIPACAFKIVVLRRALLWLWFLWTLTLGIYR